VRTAVVERLTAPRAAHDLDELAGAFVAHLLVFEDAEPREFGRFGAGDDVDEQPPAREALIRRRHLRGECW
jgi:hypothetical protein